MTTPPERWLLDTNVWIFGLRRDETYLACAQLLERIGSFSVVIPLQVLKELNLTLTENEMRGLYLLIKQNTDLVELSWQPAPLERVAFSSARLSQGRCSDCCPRRGAGSQNDRQRKSTIPANAERDSSGTHNRP